MKNTISLCLIAKNEEKRIPNLFNSLKIGKQDSVIDEVILVDTGSTDKTKEIALKYGNTVKVYDFEWIDNFEAARNFSYSKSTKDWQFWLDCDDILKEVDYNKLVKLKKEMLIREDIKVVSMLYDYGFNVSGEPTLTLERNRMNRKEINAKWVGIVHEYVDTYGLPVLKTDIRVSHTRVHSNGTRNLDIFRSMINKGFILNDRDNYYYAKELYYNGLYDEAEKQLLTVLDRNNWFEEKLQSIIALAEIYKSRKDWKAEREICYKSFEYCVPRSEFLYRIGDSFFSEERFEIALEWYRRALRNPIPTHASYLNKEYYTWLPALQMCLCYFRMDDIKRAIEYNSLAYNYNPKHPSILHNMEFFKSLEKK